MLNIRSHLQLIHGCFSGPPFTHQRTPEHTIYYGQASCESDLERYLEALKSLWHRRPQSRETPVIINTMGWVKGLLRSSHNCIEMYIMFCLCHCVNMYWSLLCAGFGFQLLVDMIRFFPVSHVVQLSYGGSNQCSSLTPEFLRTAHGCQTHPPAQTALDEFTERHNPPRSYVHLSVQSEFQGVGSQGKA